MAEKFEGNEFVSGLIRLFGKPVAEATLGSVSPNYKQPLNNLKKHRPRVTTAGEARYMVDGYEDIYGYLRGFKDGVVLQTGDSKLALCNGNLSNVATTFYHNWTRLFQDDVALSTYWWNGNWATGMKFSTEQVMYGMQWPYFSFFSCYWASTDLAIRYEN